MLDLNKYKENLSPNNVNGRLTELYKERDAIGNKIDFYIANDLPAEVSYLETIYNEIVDVIEDLCNYRHNYKDCALEGDPKYHVF